MRLARRGAWLRPALRLLMSLFFAGISSRLRTENSRIAVLTLGWIVFVGGLIWLATFPVSVQI